MLSNKLKQAVEKCIADYIPFAVYAKPMEADAVFFSNPSRPLGLRVQSDNDFGFAISMFDSKNQSPYLIQPECDVDSTLSASSTEELPSLQLEPWGETTKKDDYIIAVERIIERLKSRGGKTVYSRAVTGQVACRWGDVISDYFERFPLAFRYVYYIPETGFWLAASPEILLTESRNATHFETMSLAGTRKYSPIELPWDLKNKEEHDIVTQYIVDTLNAMGINADILPYENIRYGNIEHLCNRIIGKRNNSGLYEIANQLSPTPALAGYPLRDALQDIKDFERHPRYCYGGYVTTNDSNGFYAYVNLRCVHFSHERYCIYGGGGITAMSDALAEWEETESKMQVLRSLIEHC